MKNLLLTSPKPFFLQNSEKTLKSLQLSVFYVINYRSVASYKCQTHIATALNTQSRLLI